MPPDKDRRVISLQLSSENYELLARMATQYGIHPYEYASQLVARGLNNDLDALEDALGVMVPSDLRIQKAAMDIRKQDNIRQNLRSIAAFVSATNDEDAAEQLIQLCESVGENPDDLIREVEESASHVSGLMDVGVSETVMSAVAWLSTTMKANEEYEADAIRRLAEVRGISRNTLTMAKRRMKVQSRRNGNKWVWVKAIAVGSMVEVKK